MNDISKALLSGMIAIMMVIVAAPFMALSEESDALTHDVNMSLDSDRAIIYVAAGTNHSFTFTASYTDSCTDTISWKLNNIGDGADRVSFSDSTNTYTATGASATVYGKVKGSIEIEAYATNDESGHHAAAVIVVLDSPTATATEFYFWFNVNSDATTTGFVEDYGTPYLKSNISTWNNGFWVKVTDSQVHSYYNTTDFNAKLALDYAVAHHSGWTISYSGYGWINTFMGLGTYASGTTYYYWAQYHCAAGSGSWAFNNTTLEFITTQDHAYIGMVFWGSPDADHTPDLPTTLPNA